MIIMRNLYGTPTVGAILRHDTWEEWYRENPVLYEHEFGVISDYKRLVVGDGVTPFRDLAWLSMVEAIEHIFFNNEVTESQD